MPLDLYNKTKWELKYLMKYFLYIVNIYESLSHPQYFQMLWMSACVEIYLLLLGEQPSVEHNMKILLKVRHQSLLFILRLIELIQRRHYKWLDLALPFQTVVYLNIDMYAASFLLPVMLKLFRRHNTTFLKWRWTIANF